METEELFEIGDLVMTVEELYVNPFGVAFGTKILEDIILPKNSVGIVIDVNTNKYFMLSFVNDVFVNLHFKYVCVIRSVKDLT